MLGLRTSPLAEFSVAHRQRPDSESGLQEQIVEPEDDVLPPPGSGVTIPSTSQDAQGFQFIEETGLSRPKGAALALVRSQARRRPRKVTSQARRGRTQVRNQAERRRNPNPAASRAPGNNMPRTAGSSLSSVVHANERTDWYSLVGQFLDYFYTKEKRYSSIRPIFQWKEIYNFLLSDTASVNIALAHASKALSKAAGHQLSPDEMYYISRTIKIINKRIANSRHKPIPPSTIHAVGSLVSYELASGSQARVIAHLNGLEALIKTIGGFQALLENPMMTRHMCGIDIVISILLGSKPRFRIIDIGHHTEVDTALGARYKAALSRSTNLPILSREIVRTYGMLRLLITEKEVTAAAQKSDITDEDFQTLFFYLQNLMHRLVALSQYKDPESSEPSESTMIYNLFGNAGLAHIFLFSFKWHGMEHIPILLATRIRTSLEGINMHDFHIAYPEMMLWIIMMGGLASVGSENQDWFTNTLAEACSASDIMERGELATFLSDFLWSDFYFGPIFEGFWDNVATVQTMESDALHEDDEKAQSAAM